MDGEKALRSSDPDLWQRRHQRCWMEGCCSRCKSLSSRFQNTSPEDEEHLAELLKNHINRKHEGCSWVHLYPESHTRNPGYVENVATIKRLIELAGFRCTVGSPELEGHGSLGGITGISLDTVEIDGEQLLVGGEKPCLVLLNNDLTEGMVDGLDAQVSPPPHMGWQRRRKSEHYQCLQDMSMKLLKFSILTLGI